MKVVVDSEKCIGCEICVNMCSDCFVMKDGLAQGTDKDVSEDNHDLVKDAVDSCPVDAIEIIS